MKPIKFNEATTGKDGKELLKRIVEWEDRREVMASCLEVLEDGKNKALAGFRFCHAADCQDRPTACPQSCGCNNDRLDLDTAVVWQAARVLNSYLGNVIAPIDKLQLMSKNALSSGWWSWTDVAAMLNYIQDEGRAYHMAMKALVIVIEVHEDKYPDADSLVMDIFDTFKACRTATAVAIQEVWNIL